MKWPWTKSEQDVMDTPSAQAIVAAEEHLAEVQAQWPAVRDVNRRSREVNRQSREVTRRNHLGEAVEAILKGSL